MSWIFFRGSNHHCVLWKMVSLQRGCLSNYSTPPWVPATLLAIQDTAICNADVVLHPGSRDPSADRVFYSSYPKILLHWPEHEVFTKKRLLHDNEVFCWFCFNPEAYIFITRILPLRTWPSRQPLVVPDTFFTTDFYCFKLLGDHTSIDLSYTITN